MDGQDQMPVIEKMNGYSASWIANFFHSFPHLNSSLKNISSDFNPNSGTYQEALLLIAAVPLIWLLLWLMAYLLYFCCFCISCRKSSEKKNRPHSIAKWMSLFLSILSVMLLAGCICCNEFVHYGLASSGRNLKPIGDDIGSSVMKGALIRYKVDSLRNSTVFFLKEVFTTSTNLNEIQRPPLLEAADQLNSSLTNASTVAKINLKRHSKASFTEYDQLMEYEYYRRLSTGVVCGYLIAIFLVTMAAIGSRIKRFLLVCNVLAVFSVILLWACVATYSMASVGASDFCVKPDSYFNKTTDAQGSQQHMLYNLHQCQQQNAPLNSAIKDIQFSLVSAHRILEQMHKDVHPLGTYIVQNVTNAGKIVEELQLQVVEYSTRSDCRNAYTGYMSALEHICHTALSSMAALLLCLLLVGLFSIALVFLYHYTARYMSPRGHRRGTYVEVDTNDHYQSRDQSNRSDNPLYYRFSQISTNDQNTAADVSSARNVTASAPNRSSPPPAYQPQNRFYSTYGNTGASSTDNVNRVGNDLNRDSTTFRS